MWKLRESPSRIEKRFEFEDYQKISKFMKKIDDLCKTSNIYPNISFGKNFVSFTIFFKNEKISNNEDVFKKNIDDIFSQI
tara:strand:- start:12427 stop:12666 length:240 start_codon:yes stop_codon:yes gene_type:complete